MLSDHLVAIAKHYTIVETNLNNDLLIQTSIYVYYCINTYVTQNISIQSANSSVYKSVTQ